MGVPRVQVSRMKVDQGSGAYKSVSVFFRIRTHRTSTKFTQIKLGTEILFPALGPPGITLEGPHEQGKQSKLFEWFACLYPYPLRQVQVCSAVLLTGTQYFES